VFLVQHKQLSVRLTDNPFFITTNRNAVRESTVWRMVRTGGKNATTIDRLWKRFCCCSFCS